MKPQRSDGHRYWEHFPHEADMGIRGVGPTLAGAFAQTAMALTAVITDPIKINDIESISLSVTESDPELLLVDFLNAVIYEMATHHMLFGNFEVAIDNGHLTATAYGETVDVQRHQPAVEVKGATYTGLMVKQLESGLWLAQCVIDV